MDEPLSNLDAKLRESLRIELKHLQKTQGSTTLFVTHDQIEALTMADQIAVLFEGKVIQVGTPFDIYDRPATTFVAQLVGAPRINLIETQRTDGTLRAKDSSLTLSAQGEMPQDVLVGVRPEDVRPGEGEFRGELVLVEPLGVETILHIKTGDVTLLCVVPGVAPYGIGTNIPFSFAADRLHFFDPNGNRL
jgi:ABC-type sugar transport system ATPase subunit